MSKEHSDQNSLDDPDSENDDNNANAHRRRSCSQGTLINNRVQARRPSIQHNLQLNLPDLCCTSSDNLSRGLSNPDLLSDITPFPIRLHNPQQTSLCDPAEVERETQPLFVTFMRQRLQRDQQINSLPVIPMTPLSVHSDISIFLSSSSRPSDVYGESSSNQGPFEQYQNLVLESIARQLVDFGRVLEEEHSTAIDAIIRYLQLSSENVGKVFMKLAERFLPSLSDLQWGHIITLFYIGYRLGLSCIISGSTLVLGTLSAVFLAILRQFRLLEWIASHGGWQTILKLTVDTVSSQSSLACGLAYITCILSLSWMLSRLFPNH